MKILLHKFVEFIPEKIEEGILYVSVEYRTAVHNCACGCGNKVVTPISPTGWRLTFDGKTISLSPSIGNWSFECRSHYWITSNVIKPARQWSQEEIEFSRKKDKKSKKFFFRNSKKKSQ